MQGADGDVKVSRQPPPCSVNKFVVKAMFPLRHDNLRCGEKIHTGARVTDDVSNMVVLLLAGGRGAEKSVVTKRIGGVTALFPFLVNDMAGFCKT